MDKIAKLKELLETSPHDSFLQHALALEFIKTGDDASAKQLFETILRREPGYIGSYYHLAKYISYINTWIASSSAMCDAIFYEAFLLFYAFSRINAESVTPSDINYFGS